MTRRLTRQPGHVRRFRHLAWLAAALAATACGATPPQAPFRQAKALDSATSGIAFACGEAYQVTAFPGDHVKDLAPIRSAATRSAAKLARVDALNPDWIYQGQTIAEIVHDGTADLRACGLRDAADALKRRPRH
jgi:hypothetical protein